MRTKKGWFCLGVLLAGALLVGAAGARVAGAPPHVPLESFLKANRWQKRVLLVCAGAAEQTAWLRQQQLLETHRAGLAERDVVVRTIRLDNQLPLADRQLLQRLGVPATTSFAVLLIGKDGGVKRRETEPVAPPSLFATIDGMPMRRQEMRRPR